MTERPESSTAMQSAWDTAVAACLQGHENCSYGGMSPAGGYWLADPDCPANHGDRCTWCNAEAVTGFAGWSGANIYGVPACQPHADAWTTQHPEWTRSEEPAENTELPSTDSLLAAIEAEKQQLLARMNPAQRAACQAADQAVDNLLLWGNPDGPPPDVKPGPLFDGIEALFGLDKPVQFSTPLPAQLKPPGPPRMRYNPTTKKWEPKR